MRHVIAFASYICIFLLFFAVTAFAQDDSEELSEGKHRASLLMQKKEYQDAYHIYTSLLWRYPDDFDVNLGVARSALLIDESYAAVMAFERLVARYPKNNALRRELVSAYLNIGDITSAEHEIQILENRGEDVSSLREANEDAAKSSALFYNGRLSLGLLYDTNANAGLSSGYIIPNFYVPYAEEESSAGTFAQFALNGGYSLNERWALVGDLGIYYRYNFSSDLPTSNEVFWGRAAFGTRYSMPNYQVDVRIKNEYTHQTSEKFDNEYTNRLGVDGAFAYMVASNKIATIRGSVENLTNQVDGKDGVGWWVGSYLRMLITHRYDFSAGGRFIGTNADENRYSHLSWELSSRLGVKFRKGGLELAPFVSYRQDNYNGKYTVFDTEDREDTRLSVGAAGIWRFAESWSAELVYTFTKVDSNSIMYDYDQHLTTAVIHYKF